MTGSIKDFVDESIRTDDEITDIIYKIKELHKLRRISLVTLKETQTTLVEIEELIARLTNSLNERGVELNIYM